MNVFLLTDLEGIAGVDDIEYMDRSGEKYARARGYLTHTINLAAETCFACGAETVSFLDGHGGGGNILEAEIDPRTHRCSIAEWQALLREGRIDCQIELGSHARAGTLNGFLDHTVSSRQWFCHKVNGREMSELSLHALLCGRYGVPIAGCIGDETACAQAAEYIPGIRAGAVKRASCRNQAETYPDADDVLDREFNLIYNVFTLPERSLYVSRSRFAPDGSETRPSFAADRLRRLFGLTEERGDLTAARLSAPGPALELAAAGNEEPASAMYYNDQPADMILYQGLANRALGREDRARSRFYKLISYGEKHYYDRVKMDYFAVSLPDLQLFEEDLSLRNRAHCEYLIALGSYGLGDRERARPRRPRVYSPMRTPSSASRRVSRAAPCSRAA